MNLSFEETLAGVWRQALVEDAKVVELRNERYPVRRTPKRHLRQVDFAFEGEEIRGRSRTQKRNQSGHKWHVLAEK